jgi:hypothetical protein
MRTTTTGRTVAIASVVSALLALTAAVGSPPAAGRGHPPRANAGPAGPCALARNGGETVQDFSARLITCAAATWSVPGGADRAICIARRESGLVPHATSPNGQYLGLFQHSAKYWPGRYDDWTKPDWQLRTSALNGRTNAVVTIRMVHGIGRWVTAGWPAKGC